MKNLVVKIILLLIACVLVNGKSFKSGYDIGDIVADFKLKNVDGKNVSLADFETGKGVILIFDCNTCPYSKAYNDRIISLDKKYSSQGFPVIAINANDPEVSPGDSFTEMVEHAKKNKYSFPYLIDETQSVAKAFGATNTPHVFVLVRNEQTFKVAYIGAIDNNVRDASSADKKYVENAVDELLQKKPVTTSKTKAIGCSIKWKNS
ncbi:MAG TPA: thioredoxin family protein [Cyclobacteriaceae bacterium]